MIQLPPSEFTFSRYGCSAIPFAVLRTTDSYLKWLLAQNIIGYCNSLECEIRPRPDEMAVIFEDEDGQYWTHVPMDIWAKFLEK